MYPCNKLSTFFNWQRKKKKNNISLYAICYLKYSIIHYKEVNNFKEALDKNKIALITRRKYFLTRKNQI